MEKLNILVLHRMGDPNNYLSAVKSLEFMLPECRPNHNYIIHDTHLNFPKYLKDIDYHLIFLGPTFLCNRYDNDTFLKILDDYAFIKDTQACKIALPQDDYDCSGILDKWMFDWNVDRIYTVCPDYWNKLYPKSISKIDIKLGYTGYITEPMINRWEKVKSHENRKIDISYRASKLGANFGSVGQLKWTIAYKFLKQIPKDVDLSLDISTNPNDIIPGNKWLDFMENSKFCLVTPSGSSLIDPFNKIRECVNNFLELSPNATFEQIKDHCFSGQDKKFLFTMLSPRNIEAGLAETVQIATPGSYSGLMKPYEHFIPLEEDCSNIKEVLKMINDKSLISKIKYKLKENLLSEKNLRRENIVGEIFSLTSSLISSRKIGTPSQEKFDRSLVRYKSDYKLKYKIFWKKRYYLLKIKSNLEKNRMNSFSKILIKIYKKYFSNW